MPIKLSFKDVPQYPQVLQVLVHKLSEVRQQVQEVNGRLRAADDRIDVIQCKVDDPSARQETCLPKDPPDPVATLLLRELNALYRRVERLEQERNILARLEMTLLNALLKLSNPTGQ